MVTSNGFDFDELDRLELLQEGTKKQEECTHTAAAF